MDTMSSNNEMGVMAVKKQKRRSFKWTVEFEVAETWVADGFDLDAERANDMIGTALPFSYGWERVARVIKAPRKSRILVAQGYSPQKAAKMARTANK